MIYYVSRQFDINNKLWVTMQITELSLPPNATKITYEITPKGEIVVVKSQTTDKKEKMFSQLYGKWEGCKIQLGQLNSIQLTKNNRFQDMLKDNPFVSIQTPAPRSQDLKRKMKCNCKKSKCLKLYCECFSNQLYCSKECECQNCANVQLNSKRLQMLRQEINFKKGEVRGCRCTKSGCQKKYCDCFNRGVPCGSHCSCENC